MSIMTIRVGIVGATGYTALEAFRLLSRHPEAQVTVATSRSEAGQSIAQVHPILSGLTSLTVTAYDASAIAENCDVAMCCLPHGASAESVRELVNAGVRVIDFSADFRLSDVGVYAHHYGVEHPWPERVGKTVYGLPEWYASEIAAADLVANPGCYPQSAIIPLAPLLKEDAIDANDVIIDSKSGVSGAGRSPKLNSLYCEANESISAYAVGSHRHQPEITDLLQRFCGRPAEVIFTPHLTPMDRGILSTIYVRAKNGRRPDDILQIWKRFYDSSPFIHAVDHLPATKHVANTNHVQMTVRTSGNRLVLICAIDNLIKGASGAAVQNMNVMFGLDQRLGLL
ncbi:MAG: N-acetyl-gamma-glutamyl-phosphate reductase [Planctomycetaceae bacterium]